MEELEVEEEVVLPEPVPSVARQEEREKEVILLDDEDEEPIERPCRGFWLPLGVR